MLLSDGNQDVFITTNKGYGLWYHESEISVIGQRAAGVKAIQLKTDEYVVNGILMDELQEKRQIFITTQRGACKRMSIDRFEKSSRAKKGLVMLRELKSKPHRIVGMELVETNDVFELMTTKGEHHHVKPMELPLSDRYSNGSYVIDTDLTGDVINIHKKPSLRKVFEQTT
ncbi:topoisomerase IV subunit A [Gracilibacillus boraciitolerans JCM 21714]|uniref:Topoisomerase IV subunit A n=1 Tax=Gracilibacillus boraciitolerans JCM 21714 TaxID=1298598 RepID=W4VDM6_9BACI|nr:topoisomerase IV subunit A [Gracilibacillus boraciitolerans JCM 21714]